MYASSLLLPEHFHSRKLLLHNLLNSTTHNSSTETSSSSSYLGDSNFDTNVVMVLSVLLCALICSLGLNSIIRCALRCSNIMNNDHSSSSITTNPPLVPHRLAANTGVKKKALKTFPTITYDQKLPGLDTECVICLCDFSNGERLRILPKCNHGFHVRCIDKWLNSHSSCPTCRHCLIHTCEKIVGCESTSITTTQGGSSQVETMVRIIAPLEPEGVVRQYR